MLPVIWVPPDRPPRCFACFQVLGFQWPSCVLAIYVEDLTKNHTAPGLQRSRRQMGGSAQGVVEQEKLQFGQLQHCLREYLLPWNVVMLEQVELVQILLKKYQTLPTLV